MTTSATDRLFAGSIPALYDRLLVPLIFEPYAKDLAARVADLSPRRVLEVAAGTGVVTRELARVLEGDVEIVATDLNPAMIEQAQSLGTARAVHWQTADAMKLPFPDASFDVLACQFGAMFFPDKAAAFAEARRVLRPGGTLLFNVWDRIETNELADCVTTALATLFPSDPPRFLARTPHGYHDTARVAQDLRGGGFDAPATIDTVTHRSVAPSPREPAMAYCQGTPLRNEIEQRGSPSLEAATAHAERAIERRFGRGRIDAAIQAHVVSVRRA